jgi:hypothetical protein
VLTQLAETKGQEPFTQNVLFPIVHFNVTHDLLRAQGAWSSAIVRVQVENHITTTALPVEHPVFPVFFPLDAVD